VFRDGGSDEVASGIGGSCVVWKDQEGEQTS